MALADGTIYLDHAATTPVAPDVLQEMLPYFSERFGNASSVYRLGRQSMAALDAARERVAHVLGCRAAEIVFTGGGSEADNLAIKGIAYASRRRGNHIITSAIEHHAVLHTCQQLEREGYEVTYLPVDQYGLIDMRALESSLRDDTALVTIMYANNEIGTIEPIAEISRLCRSRGIPFHTDAVQAGPVLNLDVATLGVDLLSLSGHKFYGPKGVGMLYIRQGTRLQPQILGGSQERNRRAGTENVAGIVGAAFALERAQRDREEESSRLAGLRDTLWENISHIDNIHLTGHPHLRLPGSLSVTIAGVEGESLLLNLDLLGVAASSGSACSSGSVEPSHVLVALGVPASAARGHLRLTLGSSTTEEDIQFVSRELPQVVERLRSLSSRPASL